MIHYYVKPTRTGVWLVVYRAVRQDQFTKKWYEVEIAAGDALSYEAADQLRKQLYAEAKERTNKMHAELKALNRNYRG